MCRLNVLGSDLASFNFKLHYDILITRQRLHQITPAAKAICSHCDAHAEEDLQHALVNCSYNNGAGQNILHIVQTSLPDLRFNSGRLWKFPLSSAASQSLLKLKTFTQSQFQYFCGAGHLPCS